METKTAFETFLSLQAKLHAYSHAMGMLYIDASTNAPLKSAEGRSRTLSVLSEEAYKIETGEELKNTVAFLMEHRDELDFTQRRMVEAFHRSSAFTASIPMDEYVAYQILMNEADSIWREAKEKKDFSLFAPTLRKIVDCNRRFAGYYKPDQHPYDVLLDQYEYGLNRDTADQFFDALKATIVPLLAHVQSRPQVDDSFLTGDFPKWKQQELSKYVMGLMGLTTDTCTLAETEHPFTNGFNNKDVRITTHYYPANVTFSLFSVIHEGGHALYELGCDDALNDTCLAGGSTMGMHESQSRFYENLIGRSRAYMTLILPKLQELFPENFADVTADQLYKAINKAEPSLIRTEADELTYSLHVLVRYELEKAMIDGTLDIDDIPAAWNAKYKEYLGVDVPDDAAGCLQDMHWAGGSIGYFPSYALGSAYGAQFAAALNRDFDMEAAIADNDIPKITAWLREKIHRHGGIYHPAELIEMATGEPFDPKYFTDYLTRKFTEIYG